MSDPHRAETAHGTGLKAAAEVLWNTAPLGLTIGTLLDVRPELEVIDQQMRFAPRDLAVAPPLAADRPLLLRFTGYRHERIPLSRNVAFVDVSRFPRELAVDLRRGRINLGELFASGDAVKSEFDFGTHADAGPLNLFIRSFAPWPPAPFDTFAWRRYAASVHGPSTVVVFEALPGATWSELLEITG